MIGIAKTTDDGERRNAEGFPIVEANVPANRGNFHQEVDQSSNKALPWVAFSWFLSGGAIIGLLVMALLMPQIIEAQVAKGVAQAKAEMAQQAAEAKAIAATGREHARVALDKVEDVRTKLAEQGIKIKPLDGH